MDQINLKKIAQALNLTPPDQSNVNHYEEVVAALEAESECVYLLAEDYKAEGIYLYAYRKNAHWHHPIYFFCNRSPEHFASYKITYNISNSQFVMKPGHLLEDKAFWRENTSFTGLIKGFCNEPEKGKLIPTQEAAIENLHRKTHQEKGCCHNALL